MEKISSDRNKMIVTSPVNKIRFFMDNDTHAKLSSLLTRIRIPYSAVGINDEFAATSAKNNTVTSSGIINVIFP